MACSASLVRSAPPRDDENEQGEHRRRRPRGSRRCAPRVAPVPLLLSSPPLRSAARADARPRDATARPSSRTDRSPRASPRRRPPRRRTPRGAPNAMVRRIRRVPGACAASDRARRPTPIDHPTSPAPPNVAAPNLSSGRRSRLALRSSPGAFSPVPRLPSLLLSPHLSPTNCCAPCGPWCPPSRATSSRMRTSSPGFSSSGCARSLFEAPNSPPRVINPRGSSPAVANTARGVT